MKLSGYFARFDEWAEINSKFEGHFLERVAPGRFARTIAEDRAKIRLLLEHGASPLTGRGTDR